MPLKYLFEYSTAYLNNYGNKLQERDLVCYSCRQQFELGQLVYSKWSGGAVDHVKRHLLCAFIKNVLTEKEALYLAPKDIQFEVVKVIKQYRNWQKEQGRIGVLQPKIGN